MMTKSFQLKFATVSDIAPIVQNMLPAGATLNQFNSRNMLVIRSTAESLSDIDQIIQTIDQPTKQVCVETKFMELNDKASKQLGIRWDSLEAFGVNLQPGPFTWNRSQQNTFDRTGADLFTDIIPMVQGTNCSDSPLGPSDCSVNTLVNDWHLHDYLSEPTNAPERGRAYSGMASLHMGRHLFFDEHGQF